MKRLIALSLCVVMLICMTACGCKHEWEEATYNMPKTCIKCDEVEGEEKEPGNSYSLRNIISNASASSVYAGDKLGSHGPELLYDGKLQTNWTEDASNYGVGEYVVFEFNDIYAVKEMYIYNGSHYNEGVYSENCRPKVITLTFSDGSSERITLLDTYEVQIVELSQYYYTNSVRLTIDEVYMGTKYLDAVIAELDFVAYRP